MHSLSHRVVVTMTSILLAAACGIGVGFLIARIGVIKLDGTKREAAAALVLGEVERYDRAASEMLRAINASPFTHCSAADISFIRKQMFQSELLEDAGRLSDGRILCSEYLDPADLPPTHFVPAFMTPDGTTYYRSMTPYTMGKDNLISVQMGDAYVVLGGWHESFVSRYIADSPIKFTGIVIDGSDNKAKWLFGNPLLTNGAVTGRDAQGRVGDVLYVSRCSSNHWKCITAYNTVDEVVHLHRNQIRAFAAGGGTLGAILGFFIALLYLQNQSLESRLRQAVHRDKLQVVYQPIIDVSSGSIVGAEALARWTDEGGREVGPDLFIPVAEAHGFVGEITRLVVRHAFHDLRQPLRRRLPDFILTVNIAAADLTDPAFLPMLDEMIYKADFPKARVAFEVTERDTASGEEALETLKQLRRAGHSIHVDDFGSGYSNLSYLSQLPVDTIKVDKAFTRAIGTDSVMVNILPQILAIAEAHKLRVIVEGVETEEQADYLKGLGKPIHAQGWFFGRPAPAKDFLSKLAENEKLAEADKVPH